MPVIERTTEFAAWLHALSDARAKAKIAVRIDRLALGNAGDVKSIGGGLSEMRIDYGPGYRVYFGRSGARVLLLLCGGNKATQRADIKTAKQLYAEWKATNGQDSSL